MPLLSELNTALTDLLNHCGYWYALIVDKWIMKQQKTITMGLRYCFKDLLLTSQELGSIQYNLIRYNLIQAKY